MSLPPSKRFWPTVKLLLASARRRSKGRGKHQQKLMRQRQGKSGESMDWGCLGIALGIVFGFGINMLFVGVFNSFNSAARHVQIESQGKMAIDQWDLKRLEREQERSTRREDLAYQISRAKAKSPVDNAEVTKLEKARQIVEQESRNTLDTFFENNASKRSRERGGEREDHEKALRQHYEKSGIAGFEGLDSGFLGMSAPARAGSLTKLAALFVMGWWFLMLAFQGEGLELDFQRRRHPMWEWLMSHAVPPTAVFLAEMLSPLAANIFFIGAPAFWIGLHWMLYGDFLASLVTGLLAGVPVALAACCASKALEIATMLRLSPRTRGAVLGIMSWLGYSAFILGIISLNARPTIFGLVGWMAPVSH